MPPTADLPPEVFARVQAELDDGEGMLRAAQPDPRRMGHRMLPIQIFAIPFTLISLSFVAVPLVIGVLGGLASGSVGIGAVAGLVFSSCGLIFVAIGVAMMTAPVWAKRAAKQTAYVITDRRAIILAGGFRPCCLT
jgi:hypothetical protein